MRVWTNLCNRNASLDGSVQQEWLLHSWNQFYASLDGSVRQEWLLCSWNHSYASLNRSAQHEWFLCSWDQFCASLDRSVQHETLLSTLCELTVVRNSILNSPAKITSQISRTFHGTSWKLMEQSQKEQGQRKRLISQPRGLAQTCHRNRVCFRPRLTTPTHQAPPGWPQSPNSRFPCSPINQITRGSLDSYTWPD